MNDDTVDIPFEVHPHEHGTRADVFLSRRIKRMSRSLAAALIRDGGVRRANGEPLSKPAARVQGGDRVLLKRRKLDEAPIDDIIVPILYEDDHILAVNKPGDLIVHPTASAYHRTLIRVLRVRRPKEFLDLAHRIDKETSGLVLLARNPNSDQSLKAQFARRTIEKSYLAIVRGSPTEDTFRLDAPMRLKPDSATGVLMEIGGSDAYPALTEVIVRARGPEATLVEARPKTGRQHQIRLHLADAGYPLIGDKLYLGGEDCFVRALNQQTDRDSLVAELGHWRHALHAFRATVLHPETRTPLSVVAPLALDLIGLAERLQIPLSASL